MLYLELLFQGIVQGSIYALIALGLTLVYGLLRILHVAHAALFTLGGYLGVLITNATGSFPLAMAASMVIVGFAGIGVYKLAYEPLLGKPPFISLIASIALFIASEEIFRISFGPYGLSYTNPPLQGYFELPGGFFLKYGEALVIGLSVIMLTLLGWLSGKTRLGVTLPVAGLLAGALGFLVGLACLRVRHDFLAITTMGVVFLFVGVVRQQDFLGGAIGISGIPGSPMGRMGFMAVCLLLALAFALFSVAVKRSWMGYVYDSIADDEDVARVLGIDVARYKLIAFVIGTAAAGVAGGLYAQHFRYVGPDSFGFVESVSVLAMVVVGGIGSVAGVAVAAAVLSVLPLWIQFVDDYKILVYSALLFFMMRYAPDGLTGILTRTVKRMKGNS